MASKYSKNLEARNELAPVVRDLMYRDYIDRLAVSHWVTNNLRGSLGISYSLLMETMAIRSHSCKRRNGTMAWHARFESQLTRFVNSVADRGLAPSLIAYIDAIPEIVQVDAAEGDNLWMVDFTPVTTVVEIDVPLSPPPV